MSAPRILAPAADLAALAAGGPLLVAAAALPDLPALILPGVALARLSRAGEQVVLRLSLPSPAEALAPLDHPPAGVLALVAAEEGDLGALPSLWAAAGLPPPPLVLAEGGLAALPELLALALREAAEASRRLAAGELALAALREETEALRAAAAAMAASLPEHPAPPAGAVTIRWPAAGAAVVRLSAGAAPLRLSAGVPTAGIGAVALHLAAPGTAVLSVRLLASESGRLFGAWRVPAAALWPGWLRLDLPAAADGPPETAALTLAAEGDGGEILLSGAGDGGPAFALGSRPPGLRPLPAAFLDTAVPLPAAPLPAPLPPPAAVIRARPLAEAVPARPESVPPGPAAPASPGILAPPALPALPEPATAEAAEPLSVTLDGRQAGEGWQLLDLRLSGLSGRGERWGEIKMKFGLSGEDVTLEFRRAPGWPRAFEEWPGEETDAHGDKFVIVVGEERLYGLDRVAPGRDRALVETLAARMPEIVAAATAGGDAGPFAAAAERLAARLAPEE